MLEITQEFECTRFSCRRFVDESNSLADVTDRNEQNRIADDCVEKASSIPGEVFDRCPYFDVSGNGEHVTQPVIEYGHAYWLKEFLRMSNDA